MTHASDSISARTLPRVLQPAGWTPPKGYANGIAARGTLVFVAGQVGWNAEQRIVGDDFVAQARQALENIVAVLSEAGAGPEHIVRMTWYVVDKHEYLGCARALGSAYREVIGRHFPAMSAVQVAGLVEEGARVEIEATAVVPDP
jgi:enamine deaminase RidA (YjgF/YER057c/UK114 family)